MTTQKQERLDQAFEQASEIMIVLVAGLATLSTAWTVMLLPMIATG